MMLLSINFSFVLISLLHIVLCYMGIRLLSYGIGLIKKANAVGYDLRKSEYQRFVDGVVKFTSDKEYATHVEKRRAANKQWIIGGTATVIGILLATGTVLNLLRLLLNILEQL